MGAGELEPERETGEDLRSHRNRTRGGICRREQRPGVPTKEGSGEGWGLWCREWAGGPRQVRRSNERGGDS